MLIRMNGLRPAYSMIVEELVLGGVRYRTKANPNPGARRGSKWIPIKEWQARVRNAEVVRNSEEPGDDDGEYESD